MEFIAVRELRLRPGKVWQKLREQGQLVLTSNGRPMAILTGVKEGDFEEALALLRRVRAIEAVSQMRQAAAARGISQMSPEQIEAVINATHQARTSNESAADSV